MKHLLSYVRWPLICTGLTTAAALTGLGLATVIEFTVARPQRRRS